MRVLALETSGMAGSLAAFEDNSLVGEVDLDPTRRTAQTLAPALQKLLGEIGWQSTDVELVVVTQGPGSFTGLRIGVTTAKTFAYATGCAILGVNSLAVIAHQVAVSDDPLWVVLNAEREQLFAAAYLRDASDWAESTPTVILDNRQWLDGLAKDTIVCGPAVKGLLGQLPSGVRVAPESAWLPRAASVGRVGIKSYLAGQRSDCWSLLPNYFRESAAVEKAQAALVQSNRSTC